MLTFQGLTLNEVVVVGLCEQARLVAADDALQEATMSLYDNSDMNDMVHLNSLHIAMSTDVEKESLHSSTQ